MFLFNSSLTHCNLISCPISKLKFLLSSQVLAELCCQTQRSLFHSYPFCHLSGLQPRCLLGTLSFLDFPLLAALSFFCPSLHLYLIIKGWEFSVVPPQVLLFFPLYSVLISIVLKTIYNVLMTPKVKFPVQTSPENWIARDLPDAVPWRITVISLNMFKTILLPVFFLSADHTPSTQLLQLEITLGFSSFLYSHHIQSNASANP